MTQNIPPDGHRYKAAAMEGIQIDDSNLYIAWCKKCRVEIDAFTPDF